jgi:tetratricopeptide (TPR) repeat protein
MDHIALHLRRIYLDRLTGQLSFRRGSVNKQLVFREGELVAAKTNVPEERLGEILFKLGKISNDAHEQLGRYLGPGQPLGKTLSQKGVTSQRNVDDGLTYQMREIALSLFPYFNAEIAFQERAVTDAELAVRVNVPYLIEDGVRRMKVEPPLREHLAKRAPVPKGRDFIHLLTEEEKQLLQIIKGGVPCETLWRAHKYNPDFFWRTIFLLYCLDIIELDRDGAKPAASPSEPQPKPAPPPAAAPAPPAEPPAAEDRVQEVLAFRERLPELNYYQILNVPRTAGEEEIKKAYFQLARRFHPDTFDRSLPANHRVQIEDVFDRITKAYRTLTSQEGRQEYDGKMTSGGEEKPRDTLARADTKFRQAKTLYGQGRYEDAMALLEEVVRLNKNKGGYYLLLAMAETRLVGFEKKAEGHFLKAIELEPWNPEGFVGLGVLYRQVGLSTKATRQFQKALELDGEHEVALRELETLTKKERKPGLKGLLSMDIFGSKKK